MLIWLICCHDPDGSAKIANSSTSILQKERIAFNLESFDLTLLYTVPFQVHFIEGDALTTVHLLDDEESRKGPWEEIGRDRTRFARRIKDVEAKISNAFLTEHRQKIYLLLSKNPCFHLSSDVGILPGSSPIL